MKRLFLLSFILLFFLSVSSAQEIELFVSGNSSIDLYYASHAELVNENKSFRPSFGVAVIGRKKMNADFDFDFGIKYLLLRRKYETTLGDAIVHNNRYKRNVNETLLYSVLPVGINVNLDNANFQIGIQSLILLQRKGHITDTRLHRDGGVLSGPHIIGLDILKYKKIRFEGYIGYSKEISNVTEMMFQLFWRFSNNDLILVEMPSFRFAFGMNRYIIKGK